MEILFEEELKGQKNLLAFSGGVDSTALFYLLLEKNIPFDIAYVRFSLRKQSFLEESRIKALAFYHNKHCYCKVAPKLKRNFEYEARVFRYDFFDCVMKEGGYENLLLAHQLNDKIEWFFMQFIRGSELERMLLSPLNKRKGYRLVRPLLQYSRKCVLEYLQSGGYFYFEDYSNRNTRFLRNHFRGILECLPADLRGVQRSFDLLENKERKAEEPWFCLEKLVVLSTQASLREIDIACKELGYCLSFKQQSLLQGYLEKADFSLVFGGVVAVEKCNERIFIAPFVRNIKLPKEFKEACRLAKIPAKIRPYLYHSRIDLDFLAHLKYIYIT